MPVVKSTVLVGVVDAIAERQSAGTAWNITSLEVDRSGREGESTAASRCPAGSHAAKLLSTPATRRNRSSRSLCPYLTPAERRLEEAHHEDVEGHRTADVGGPAREALSGLQLAPRRQQLPDRSSAAADCRETVPAAKRPFVADDFVHPHLILLPSCSWAPRDHRSWRLLARQLSPASGCSPLVTNSTLPPAQAGRVDDTDSIAQGLWQGAQGGRR